MINFICDRNNTHTEEVPVIAPIISELVAALLTVGARSTIFSSQEAEANASFIRSITRLMIFSSLAHIDISFRPFIDVLATNSDSTSTKSQPTYLEFRDHPRTHVAYVLSYSLAQILARHSLDLWYTVQFFAVVKFAMSIPKSSVVYGESELFPLLLKLLARLSARRAKLTSNRPIAETLPVVITSTLDLIYLLLRGGYPPIKKPCIIVSRKQCSLRVSVSNCVGTTLSITITTMHHAIFFKMIFERQMPHVFYPSVLKLFRAGRERLRTEASESLIFSP